MQMLQVKLVHTDPLLQGQHSMVVWVEKKKGIKKGCSITLKDTKHIKWNVADVYTECDSTLLKTDWEVGGLGKRQRQ